MSTKVPSWQVTAAMLAEWGFPVERRDKCVGMAIVESPGSPWHVALNAAWAAGFVELRSMPEAERVRRREAFHARNAGERAIAAESLAFLRAHGSIREGLSR